MHFLRIPLLEYQVVMGLFLSKSPSLLNTLSLPPLDLPERLLLPCRQKQTNTSHLIHLQRRTLCYSTSFNWLLSNCGDSYAHAQSLYIYVASYTTIFSRAVTGTYTVRYVSMNYRPVVFSMQSDLYAYS